MEGLSTILSISSLPWYLLNFLLLVIAVRIFLYKPVVKFMNERAQRVQAERDEINESKKELESKINSFDEERNQRMQEAEKEVSDRLIRADGDAKAIIKDAQAQAEHILDVARKAAREEAIKAREDLREEISRLSIGLASRILEREIKQEDHQQLVDEFLDKVG